jgi:hypothetical protein
MSLQNDVSKYLIEDAIQLENTKTYYKDLDFDEAIQNAAKALDRNGRLNNHQHRIGKKKCDESATEVLKYKNDFKKCKTFKEIFQLTEKIRKDIYKLGDLWSYDTALRIGFHLDMYPDEVYVQQGVVKGVKKIFNGTRPRGRSLPMNIFPKEIQQMEPFKVENFLCIWGKGKGKSSPC